MVAGKPNNPACRAAREAIANNYGAHPAVFRDDLAARAHYRHRQCLRQATRPTSNAWGTPQASDNGGTESCAGGPSASAVGANSSSSDSSNSNASVACTRFLDQAGGSSRRTPSRSKVPHRPRTQACRPIPLRSDRHRSSAGPGGLQQAGMRRTTSVVRARCPWPGGAAAKMMGRSCRAQCRPWLR